MPSFIFIPSRLVPKASLSITTLPEARVNLLAISTRSVIFNFGAVIVPSSITILPVSSNPGTFILSASTAPAANLGVVIVPSSITILPVSSNPGTFILSAVTVFVYIFPPSIVVKSPAARQSAKVVAPETIISLAMRVPVRIVLPSISVAFQIRI